VRAAAVGAAAVARSFNSCLGKGAFAVLAALAPGTAAADEGGNSFWLPGTFGSFAAMPAKSGWSLPASYYHRADADLLLVAPTFTSPKAEVSLGTRAGRVDDRSGLADWYAAVALKKHEGVHHYFSYTMLGVPGGNVGTNHWALDGGGGYTYFDEDTTREFSAVLGFTYNFRNPDTDYRNGLSMHLDWSASQGLAPQWRAGLVGYFYGQLGADHGPGEIKSSVSAIGPQLAWNRVSLKAYYEFGAKNRPEGWNTWLTVAFPL